ncbi:ATP-binding cassette domain-containing protein [Novosphingobium sp. YJ-S2-02]|uniref:ATP-binding cassette domain-containing protein n=1 Tax=Novosphingobium aureum TaxID=2792964 RepID=A0A931HDN2_9SPHN|nr:ABC transporter transmembrane domain-containing protein [Novosphingobium aureum]MBH0114180.1 ATP-binding cassette domain-containing protein [Novosphingobium aureum]
MDARNGQAEPLAPETVDQTSPSSQETSPDAPQTGEDAASGKSKRSLRPLAMVWRELFNYPGRMVTAGLALLTTATSTLAIPYGFRQVIDQGFAQGADHGVIRNWFLMLLGVVVVLAVATAIRYYSVSWLGERVIADIRLRVQSHLLSLAPSFFEENSPKEIASRMTADTAVIEQVVGSTVSVALRNVIMAIGGVIYLFALAPMLTAGLLIAIPLVILPITVFGRRLRAVARKSQDRVADIGAMTSEVLGALRVVQAFNQEGREAGRFAGAVESTFETGRQRIHIRAVMTGVLMFLIFGAITAIMWRGAIGVAEGTITGGTIAAFVVTAGIVAGAFGSLTEVYGDLVRGAGAASRLAELLAERPAIAAPARAQAMPEPGRGKIAFEKVTFRYPARPDVAALVDFNLTVEPGETVAIVGPSGAGKSTLFQLAERFYDPQGGAIKIDGVPLTSTDPAQVRARIALVPQEGVLFAASARENLRYGKPDASDEAIWEAARAANAQGFLSQLPEGLDTFLGEDGARLSGGQRQRIAIARALLRDSPILLLDEATSALDAESERLVQDALEHLMQDRTTLVIAHRLSTVRKADRIVVMDGGQIVEQGTHESLAQAGGLYARLAALQFDAAQFDAARADKV